MDAITFSDVIVLFGSVALIIFLTLFGTILFYTITILRIIYEVVTLAKKQATDLSVKAEDIKKYVGGSMMIRLLMLFFRRKSGK